MNLAIAESSSAGGEIEKKKNRKECQICTDVASGCHFGVMACEGCKGFFRRNIQKNAKFVCFYDNKCDVFGVKKRKSCQKCRMDACLKQGMNAAMIKKNNINRNRNQSARSRSEILAPPRRDFSTFSHGVVQQPRPSAVEYPTLPKITPLGSSVTSSITSSLKVEPESEKTPFGVKQIDKTAGFERMRYSLGELNPKRESSPDQKRSDHLGDSGIALSGNGDEDGRSAVSRASTANTENSRPSVIRKSEKGRIYVMDSVTRDYYPDDQRSYFHPIPVQRTMPPVETHRTAASLPARPVKRPRLESNSRETAKCDDELTRVLFNDMTETIKKVRNLCLTCYQYRELNAADREKLFESSIYELVLIYVYFENRHLIQSLAEKSSSMIRGIVDSLDKCEIHSWSEATNIIMMSLLSYQSYQTIFVDPEKVKDMQRQTKESLQRSMSDSAEDNGLQRYVNVFLLMPRLREVNDHWKSSKLDQNGAPIIKEKPIQIKFGEL